MRTTKNNPYKRTLIAGGALLVLVLAAGCDSSDTLVFVEDNPPAIPSGVYTVTGDGMVEVFWNPVREDDVAGYGVYRSDALDGVYTRIATLGDVENDRHTDFDVVNGVTYFYAVDAFDAAGHESDLSFEAAFDTPRPDGFATVFARLDQPGASGLDFSDWNSPSRFVTQWDAPDTDVYFQTVGQVLYVRGTLINGLLNDIQDLGWTGTMDEVSWAPTDGWSVAPNGVELIEGHTYVVWTHDSFFAKFRVTTILTSQGAPTAAEIEWAYQIDQNNPELSPLFRQQPGSKTVTREAS